MLNDRDFFASATPVCNVLTVGLFAPLLERSPKGEANSPPSHSSKHSNPMRQKKKGGWGGGWEIYGKERHFPKENLSVRLPISGKQRFCVPDAEDMLKQYHTT